jgi:hypothetical protein
MPTVITIGPYRFYFFSHEGLEPAHIHVDRDNSSVKFWIYQSVTLASSHGFSPKEIRIIQGHVEQNQKKLLEAWNGYFGSRSR